MLMYLLNLLNLHLAHYILEGRWPHPLGARAQFTYVWGLAMGYSSGADSDHNWPSFDSFISTVAKLLTEGLSLFQVLYKMTTGAEAKVNFHDCSWINRVLLKSWGRALERKSHLESK